MGLSDKDKGQCASVIQHKSTTDNKKIRFFKVTWMNHLVFYAEIGRNIKHKIEWKI